MSGNKANESKKVGDELFIVESNLASVEEERMNYIFHSSTEIDDIIRKKFGAFWVKPPVGKQAFMRTKSPNTPIKRVRVISEETFPESGITHQEMELTFDNLFTAAQNYEQIRDFLREDREYYDHATTINIYEEGNNLAEQAAGILNLYAEVKSDYNFLERTYEEFLSSESESIRELDLPNFYNFLMRDSGDISEKIDRSVILTQGGRIKLGDPNKLVGDVVKPVSDYFSNGQITF